MRHNFSFHDQLVGNATWRHFFKWLHLLRKYWRTLRKEHWLWSKVDLTLNLSFDFAEWPLASCLAFCEVLIVKEVKGVLEKRILSWNKWSECCLWWLLIGGKSVHSVLKRSLKKFWPSSPSTAKHSPSHQGPSCYSYSSSFITRPHGVVERGPGEEDSLLARDARVGYVYLGGRGRGRTFLMS